MTEEQRWVLRSVRNTVGHPINHDLADAIDAALRRIERLEKACHIAVSLINGVHGGDHAATAANRLQDALEGRD